MIDRFNRLRHHGVVSRHYQNGDVGCLGAAGTHRGESRVARGIDEGDQLTVFLNLVSTDVLGDATGFTRNHIGVADRVEQRGLAVVDVTHDGDNRRPRYHFAVFVLDIENAKFDVGFRYATDSVAEFAGDDFSQIGINDVAGLHHLAFLHQVLDHVDRPFGHPLREFLDGDGFRQLHFAHDLFTWLLRHRAAHLFLTATHRRKRTAPRIAVIIERGCQRQLAATTILFSLRASGLGRFRARNLGPRTCRSSGARRRFGLVLATPTAAGVFGRGSSGSIGRRVGGGFACCKLLLFSFLGKACVFDDLSLGVLGFLDSTKGIFLRTTNGVGLGALALFDVADAAILQCATTGLHLAR